MMFWLQLVHIWQEVIVDFKNFSKSKKTIYTRAYRVKLLRRRATFGLLSYRTGRMHILQFSLKEPWLLPKCDRDYGEDKNIVLYGWLFIYFGYTDLKNFQK